MTSRIRATAVAAAVALALSACGSGGTLDALGKERERPETTPEDQGQEEEPEEDEPEEPGTAELPAKEISRAASQALLDAEALRLTGTGETDDGMVDLDIHIDSNGDCAGEIGFEGQGTIEVLRRGDEVWMRPDAEFWKAGLGGEEGAQVAEFMDGKYLYGTTDDADLADVAEICDLDNLLGDLEPVGVFLSVTKGEESVHKGIPVIGIVEEDIRGDTSTVLVATEGEPYPLHITGTSDGETFTLDLSDFDVPVEFDAPADDLVIDVSEL
ncbi:hypothetical protein GCM10009716_22430 [Streptomyces sodiiphilus]|uniref:Lipoprotein n=1 Tax=Streptomyces sodiiphilus TaxID=226217 RepID=A0ABN2P6Y1_9ACTN